MCSGVGLVTYLRRSGVDGYELAGMAKVLLGARRIDRDEYRPLGPTDFIRLLFQTNPPSPKPYGKMSINWLVWLGASSPGGYQF
ncbi:hypothetical protein AGR6A_pAt50109 [Agrobacterium sp. NCPPB 925]|nr:hypothetical protein AGR6A_pAt50109 [Agrobacterium sp. NCPPB 925]